MVSASNATEPEISTITSCAIEVAPSASRLIFTARIPAALDSSAPSMLSEASWLCGANTSRTAAPNLPPSWLCPCRARGRAVTGRCAVLCVVGHARSPLCRAGVGSEAVSGCRVRSSSVLR